MVKKFNWFLIILYAIVNIIHFHYFPADIVNIDCLITIIIFIERFQLKLTERVDESAEEGTVQVNVEQFAAMHDWLASLTHSERDLIRFYVGVFAPANNLQWTRRGE